MPSESDAGEGEFVRLAGNFVKDDALDFSVFEQNSVLLGFDELHPAVSFGVRMEVSAETLHLADGIVAGAELAVSVAEKGLGKLNGFGAFSHRGDALRHAQTVEVDEVRTVGIIGVEGEGVVF